jgi:hypothetical protein
MKQLFGDRLKGLFQREPVEYTAIQSIRGLMIEELMNELAGLKFGRQGVIFYSTIGFPRYRKDYERLLKAHDYRKIEQDIDPRAEIHEELRGRIGEKLAEALRKDIKGSITPKLSTEFASLEAELSEAIQTNFRRPEKLVNIIEAYLEGSPRLTISTEIRKFLNKVYRKNPSLSLMIVILNASDFTLDNFERTIRQVFSVSVPSTDQRAGLTLVCSSSVDDSKLLYRESWLNYNPEKIISDSWGKIWSLLEEEMQNCFENQETFRKLLSISKGGTDLLEEEWNRLWKVAKENHENTISYH